MRRTLFRLVLHIRVLMQVRWNLWCWCDKLWQSLQGVNTLSRHSVCADLVWCFLVFFLTFLRSWVAWNNQVLCYFFPLWEMGNKNYYPCTFCAAVLTGRLWCVTGPTTQRDAPRCVCVCEHIFFPLLWALSSQTASVLLGVCVCVCGAQGHRTINSGACECWTWGSSAAPFTAEQQHTSSSSSCSWPHCRVRTLCSCFCPFIITQGREGKNQNLWFFRRSSPSSLICSAMCVLIEHIRTSTLCSYGPRKMAGEEIKAPLVACLWSSFVVNLLKPERNEWESSFFILFSHNIIIGRFFSLWI